MRARAFGGWLALAASAAACSGAPAPGRAVAPAALDLPLVPIATPARWAYHPPAPGGVLAVATLDDGRCLFTAPGGQRWVATPDTSNTKKAPAGRRVCSGRAEVASAVASEDLVGVERRGDHWLFVGAAGTLYRADTPLGPFTRTEAPPEPLARVTAGARVMGLSASGGLYEWSADHGFRALPRPEAHLGDIAADEKGKVLGLAIPEALLASDDGGASWKPLAAPAIGARRVGVTDKGELAAQGLFESLVFRDLAAPPTRTKEQALAVDVDSEVEIGPQPSASSVASGQAALDGDRYVEARKPEPANKDRWQLARGKLDGKLEIVPTPAGKECRSVQIALRGNVVAFACIHARSDGANGARVRRSFDFGTTWGDAVELATADNEVTGLAAAPDGAVLVAGVCKDTSAACKASVTVLVRGDARHPTAISSAAEQLAGGAQSPAFSFDGRSAYFLGKRGKDERVALFVSHDGGETFSQRPLALATPPASPASAGEDDDDDGPREHEQQDPEGLDLDDRTFVRATEDGTVGILLRTNQPVYVLVDDDGHVLASAFPPNERATLGGFGRRAIAFGPSSDGPNSMWESTDGGATWEETSAPPPLGNLGSDATVVCAAAGCLVGDTLTRVGWGGAAETSTVKSTSEARTGDVHLLTPMTCELAPTRWTRIDDVFQGELPRISEAARGKTLWSLMTHDPKSGAVSVVVATAEGEDVRVSTRSLLGPSSGHEAVYLGHQIEGYAAARVAYPVDAKGAFKPGGPMRNVEVAWENFVEGTSPRAHVADAGVFEKEAANISGAGAWYQPGFISIAAKGMFFRPHAARAKDQAVDFFDASGRLSRHLQMPHLPTKGFFGALSIIAEGVTIDGVPTPVGFVHESATTGDYSSALLIALAPRAGATFVSEGREVVAKAIAPQHGDMSFIVQSQFTYLGKGTAGEVVTVSDPRRGVAWADFNALREGAAAVPVPTVLDLGDRPRPCSASDRSTTARVEARVFTDTAGGKIERALFPGSGRPILVVEPQTKGAVGVSAPTALMEIGTIAYGTPKSPCAAGHVARGVRSSPFTAAIVTGDLKRGFLFRPVDHATTTKRDPRATAAVEYRPMTCRFDPGAKLPDAVLAEPGVRTEKER